LKTQRDEFIEKLFVEAKKDSSIIFISVDMGAPALDQWREELPNQFIVAGISEQNAINLAAGLSRAGKKPYVYMMACWVARCFEQIRFMLFERTPTANGAFSGKANEFILTLEIMCCNSV
jgi:transketolase C-terminal domain/subunit